MMHPYITFADGTEVVHSDLIQEDGIQKVLVHFERPTEHGFDSIRCELPSCRWTLWEGHFSDKELAFFDEFVHANAALLYKYAASGGINQTLLKNPAGFQAR